MGCAGSKQWPAKPWRRRRNHLPAKDLRCYSVPITGGDVGHSVALKSSTLGSLRLDRDDEDGDEEMFEEVLQNYGDRIRQAKEWSAMIEQRIPLTPPGGEREVINVWELMEGLDDGGNTPNSGTSTTVPPNTPPTARITEFSTQTMVSSKPSDDDEDAITGVVSDISPSAIPVATRHHLAPRREIPKFTGIVRARVDAFQGKIRANHKVIKCSSGGGKDLVLYFTSLRGIRRTYDDCCAVKTILQGYGIRIDERDVSLHGGFKTELNELIGGCKLPRVFLRGKDLGGADDIRRMHEEGELSRVLEGCEMALPGKGSVVEACSQCDGVGFVPCNVCSGSCKVFMEDADEDGGKFRRCSECNENGLVRCPVCCI